jgi:hypothetical protein
VQNNKGGAKVLPDARWFIFKPKILIWVKIWKALEWKMLSYFMNIWNILLPFGIINGRLV